MWKIKIKPILKAHHLLLLLTSIILSSCGHFMMIQDILHTPPKKVHALLKYPSHILEGEERYISLGLNFEILRLIEELEAHDGDASKGKSFSTKNRLFSAEINTCELIFKDGRRETGISKIKDDNTLTFHWTFTPKEQITENTIKSHVTIYEYEDAKSTPVSSKSIPFEIKITDNRNYFIQAFKYITQEYNISYDNGFKVIPNKIKNAC